MIQRLSNPESVIFWWMTAGLVLGFYFGLAIRSFTIGLPMGLAVGFLSGKVACRVSQGLLRR